MIKNKKGVISIFLALVIMPTYMFAIMSVDIARIYAADNYLKLANEAAISSIFFNYDKDLYERFGILAINAKDRNLTEEAREILELNLNTKQENSNMNLLNVVDVSLDLEQSSKLVEIDNFEKQIVDQMKYKAPIKLINGFMHLIDLVEKSKSYNEVLAKKLEYNSQVDKFAKKRDDISNLLITYSNQSKSINDVFFSYKKESKNIKKSIKDYNLLKNKLSFKVIEYNDEDAKLLDKLINEILKGQFIEDTIKMYSISKLDIKVLSTQEKEKFINTFDNNRESFSKLYSIKKYRDIEFSILDREESIEIEKVVDMINIFRRKMIELENTNLNEMIKPFYKKYSDNFGLIATQNNLLNDLLKEVEKINSDNELLDKALDEWEESINDIKDDEIKNQFKTEFTFTSKKYSDENINAVINQLNRDSEKIALMKQFVNPEIPGELALIDDLIKYSSVNNYELFDKITKLNSLENYALYKGLVTEQRQIKLTKEEKKEAKNTFKTIKNFNDKNNIQSIKNKTLYDFIDKGRVDMILNGSLDKLEASTKLSDIQIENQDDLAEIINMNNENINIDSKSNNLLINNILIASYISDNFNSKFNLDDEGFISQKEFILFGSEKLNHNILKSNSIIFTTRLGLNSIYAFSNPTIRKEALALAVALAGWTGIGVPLMETLIVSMMTFGETLVDMSKLEKNENVEGFKNNSSWQVSLNGLKNLAIDEASQLAKESIDNIFDRMEEISYGSIDEISKTLDEFISQSHDGIIQSINGSILTPIQNIIMQAISDPYNTAKGSLEEVITDLEVLIDSEENLIIKNIKKSAIKFVKENYLAKLDILLEDINKMGNQEVIDFIEEMTVKIEVYLKEQLKGYSDEFKTDITNVLKERKDNYKQVATDKINQYLGKFRIGKTEKMSMFTKSALSLNYEDYIKLMLIFGLNGPNKIEILKRVALVMEYELRKKDSDFDFTKLYGGASITTNVNLNLFIKEIPISDKLKIINNTLRMEY